MVHSLFIIDLLQHSPEIATHKCRRWFVHGASQKGSRRPSGSLRLRLWQFPKAPVLVSTVAAAVPLTVISATPTVMSDTRNFRDTTPIVDNHHPAASRSIRTLEKE